MIAKTILFIVVVLQPLVWFLIYKFVEQRIHLSGDDDIGLNLACVFGCLFTMIGLTVILIKQP